MRDKPAAWPSAVCERWRDLRAARIAVPTSAKVEGVDSVGGVGDGPDVMLLIHSILIHSAIFATLT